MLEGKSEGKWSETSSEEFEWNSAHQNTRDERERRERLEAGRVLSRGKKGSLCSEQGKLKGKGENQKREENTKLKR